MIIIKAFESNISLQLICYVAVIFPEIFIFVEEVFHPVWVVGLDYLFAQLMTLITKLLYELNPLPPYTLVNLLFFGTALSTKTGAVLPGTNQAFVQDVFTTIVNVSLIIEEVVIDDKNMVIAVDGVLNQEWVDPRLGANELTRKMAVAGQVWEPKITIINGDSKYEEIVFWRGFGEEGNIFLSKKIKIDLRCTADLREFPFDTQFCTMKLGSYRFPNDEVTILWDEEPIVILNEPKTHEFRLSNVSKDIITDIKPSGNFTTATAQFVIKRYYTHYLLCTGTPCFLLVLLSYISLWMELDKRWNLNLLTFIGNLYLYHSSICLLFPVPYWKALDIFSGLCTFFSLLSLLESFLANSIFNMEQKYYHSHKSASLKKFKRMINLIELGMKIAYPIFYSFFVSLYIFVYIS